MSKSILLIEADSNEIRYIRRWLNEKNHADTRNMVWHEDRVLRFDGGTTFEALSKILDRVMTQTKEPNTQEQGASND